MTQREQAHRALLHALVGSDRDCEHCHLHYKWRDNSGKHAVVEVATNCAGKWSAHLHLWRSTPTADEPENWESVKQETKHGHATAADAIAAIFDGGAPLWAAPRETT